MGQSKMTKVMALMLSLTMITSVFVGNTLSRYVTSVSSTDSARVAIWGINGEEVIMELFNTAYDLDGKKIAEANLNDDGTTRDKIIAPGTGGQSAFSIINFESDTIPPEVAYELKITLDDSQVDSKIVNNTSIQWKLDEGSWGTFDQLKISLLTLSGNSSGMHTYAPGEFAESFKDDVEHKIYWKWVMDGNDVTDTQMGNDALVSDIGVKIAISITAEQSDGSSVNMLDGANQVINNYNPEPAVFRSVAPKADFESVTIDGSTVDPSNYEVTEGSTIITFNKDYLETLSEGTHTININSKNDFVASAKFFVKKEYTPITHNGIIPEGGVYYTNVKQYCEYFEESDYYYCTEEIRDHTVYDEKLEAGDEFPVPKTGDAYIYGDYEYRFNMEYDICGSFESKNMNGWGVIYIGRNSVPGKLLDNINGYELKSISNAFVGMMHLTQAPVIPETVIYMNEVFLGCDNITGTIEINANPIDYGDALFETKINKVIGTTTLKNEILGTTSYDFLGDGTYYVGVENVNFVQNGEYSNYTAKYMLDEKLPEAQTGDIYIYGDYEYRYNMEYDGSKWVINEELDGWGVKARYVYYYGEITSIDGEILSKINDKNVVSMSYTFSGYPDLEEAPVIPSTIKYMVGTFAGCQNLKKLPVIPNGVIDMSYTFEGCYYMEEAPVIPNSVVSMRGTFLECYELKEAPEIPEKVENLNATFAYTSISQAPVIPNSVKYMNSTFYYSGLRTILSIPESVLEMDSIFEYCTNLTGTIEINANPDRYDYAFKDTEKPIILTGSSSLLNEIAATGVRTVYDEYGNESLVSGNVTVSQ